MRNPIHFISGLPRSGSTLLAAILRKNPRIHARASSPLGHLFPAVLAQLTVTNEFAPLWSDPKRRAILKGLFESYYQDMPPGRLIFDTNRLWCAKLPALADLFPEARLIACVRHMPWIFDSFERLARRNKFQMSKIYDCDPAGTVYSRVESLANGIVGFARNALREAFYGEESERMLVLTYETLTHNPARALAAVYDWIGEKPFPHDFRDVSYAEADFDAWIGTPGLHTVAPEVRPPERKTILPPDLFHRFENDSFWADARQNLRSVRVV